MRRSRRAAGPSAMLVGNDTFAVLRAGTERGWGVAVVCGAGINCVGVAPDGRARALSGARGDHRRLGRRLRRRSRRRSPRPRGARTDAGRRRRLERAVPASLRARHAERAGRGDPPRADPAAARDRAGAGRPSPRPRTTRSPRGSSQHLADEVVALARVALARLELTDEPVEVLLGGGVLQDAGGDLLAAIDAGLREVAPHVTCQAYRVRCRSSAPRCSASTSSVPTPTRRTACRRELGTAFVRPGRCGVRWLTFATSRRRASIRAPTRRRSPRSTWTSRTASSWCSSGLRAPGKTTALRMLAGLEEVDAGAVFIGDRGRHRRAAEGARHLDGLPELRALPVSHRRREHRLSRCASPGSRRRSGSSGCRRWRSCSASPSISSASRRSSRAGSGSGLRWDARSSALPSVFLMDEPLSNLDAKLRVQMRADIAALQARLRDHHRLRHARPGRGDDARAPGRGARRRAAAAVRHAARALRAAGERLRRRVHRLARDEPLHRAASPDGTVSLGGVELPLPQASPRRTAGRARVGVRPEALELAADGVAAQVDVVEEVGADAYVFCSAEIGGDGHEAGRAHRRAQRAEAGRAGAVAAAGRRRAPVRPGQRERLQG